MDNQNLNTDTKNADKPELHGLPCSKLGRLGAKRHEDLMAYLPAFEKSLGERCDAIEEIMESGEDYEDDGIVISEQQARWMLNCMAFIATLPKYLED
jgi:hypothetical protein